MLIISCRLQSFVNFADTQTRFSDIAMGAILLLVSTLFLVYFVLQEFVRLSETIQKAPYSYRDLP